jgi:hypothetical protein
MSGVLLAALGFAGAGFLFLLKFLLKLLEPLLQKDLEEGIPWLVARLVRRAARKLPVEHQQRFEEEWLTELTAIPGVMVFKLRFAVRVYLRASSTGRAMQGRPPWWEEVLRRLVQAIVRAWGSYMAPIEEYAARERARRQGFGYSLSPLVRKAIGFLAGVVRGAREVGQEALEASRDPESWEWLHRLLDWSRDKPDDDQAGGTEVMRMVIGLPDKTVSQLCRTVRRQVGKVFPANSKAPGQVVISGESAAVEEATRRALAAGAKEVLALQGEPGQPG